MILYTAADTQARQQAAARAAAEAEASRSRTAGEVVGDIGAQLLQGAVGLGQAAYGVGNMATLGLLDRATGMSRNFAETNDTINSWKSAPTQAALARSSASFDEGIGTGLKNAITDPVLLQDLLVSNLPSIIPAGAGAQFGVRGLEKGSELVGKYAARISLRLIDEEGNTTRTLNIEGGDDAEMMLRLAIASLWMHTTQQSFIDVAVPVDDQLADIKRTVTEYRNTINRDKALIKRLTNELAAAQARLARITAIAS